MKKAVVCAFLVLLMTGFLSVLAPQKTLADGILVVPDDYSGQWNYGEENNQQAVISYKDGFQKMALGIKVDEGVSGAVWLFPVPASPDRVVMKIAKDFPNIEGREIKSSAKENIIFVASFVRWSEIFPLMFFKIMVKYGYIGDIYGGSLRSALSDVDVVVQERIEAEGLISELITARTADGLYNYLRGKNLNIENGELPVLNKYINQDYSFVVSWLTGENAIKKDSTILEEKRFPIIPNQYNSEKSIYKTVLVAFPTEKLYFPLLPTSVYGSKVVPATIRVLGLVTPEIFDSIKGFTNVEYFEGGSFDYAISNDSRDFLGISDNFTYTKIDIKAPSKLLTDDLWFENKTPVKVAIMLWASKNQIVLSLLFLIFSSISAGIIAGLIVFKNLRKKIGKLALLGLSNCLTIFGLIVATINLKTQPDDQIVQPVLDELKVKGYIRRRLIAYSVLLYCPFVMILLSLIKMWFFDWTSDYGIINKSIGLVLIILPIYAIVQFFFSRKIHPEDKHLFEALKASNYSTWRFKPKDNNKYLFVILFSIIFLVITWGLQVLLTALVV